jgi:hypothetical protein
VLCFGRAARLNRRFAASLTSAGSHDAAASLVGLEHEYRLLDGERQVDFRQVIRSLALSQHHLDPGDPYAYRVATGAVVTCDQAEAEVVLPPTRVGPHFARQIEATAARERRRLMERLPRTWTAEGYSTHISVAIPAGAGDRLAKLYTRTFAPALMLLMDNRDSPGLLVRPRPGRLELCGEFVDGISLRSAVAFATGSVAACLDALGVGVGAAAGAKWPLSPAELVADVTGAHQRFGWFVRRDAFGSDLYSTGRSTVFTRVDGGQISAQQQLSDAWVAARTALSTLGVVAADLDCVDSVVAGSLPLPIEGGARPSTGIWTADVAHARDNEFGALLEPRQRPGFEVAPVMATWDLSVFVLAHSSGPGIAFASVPRPYLRPFLDALDAGSLDAVMRDYLNRWTTALQPRRRLSRRRAAEPGLWDGLPARKTLLAPERRPAPTRSAA